MKPFLLWDVDGTLLDSNDVGPTLYREAAKSVVGEVVAPSGSSPYGKTDLINSQNMLRDHGLSETEVVAGAQLMLDLLPSLLQRLVDDGHFTPNVLPGVVEVLEATQEAGALNTLLTGNLPETARIKMEAAGLHRYFQFEVGAYGADAQTRPGLLPVALERAALHGQTFDNSEVWVIGDTPHDFEVAHCGGVRCLLVASGMHGHKDLLDLNADALLPDLADAALVLRTLLS